MLWWYECCMLYVFLVEIWFGTNESRWVLLNSPRRAGCSPKTNSSRLSEELSPERERQQFTRLSVLRTRLSEGLSPEWENLTWARWASLSETLTCPLFAISPKRDLVAWTRGSLAWARLTVVLHMMPYMYSIWHNETEIDELGVIMRMKHN